MKTSFSIAAALLSVVHAAPAPAPNGPWPTAQQWGPPNFPKTWPTPPWAQSCYQPTATAAPANSAPITAATTTLGTTVTRSASAAATAAPTGPGGAPAAKINNGTILGVHNSNYNQDYFLGVPYAQPPIGDLRFRPPQSINASVGTFSATQYSPECVGYGGDQVGYDVSEDCLYANIIRPANYSSYKEPLPVAVWIHGGGYFMGGGVDRRYNLSFIVQNGVEIDRPFIGISINYRLSAWGFLFSDQVLGSGNTNLGLRDQRLALHWVHENIAAFGGDPSKVTIWGESAGASAVGFQLIAYGGRNDSIISGAIMESGNSVPYKASFGTDYYQPYYNTIVNSTGCANAVDTLGCLRVLPFTTLNAAVNTSSAGVWYPIIDGDFIRKYSSIQMANGEFLKVPIISGANTDEGISFGPNVMNSTAQFTQAISAGSILPGAPLVPALAQQLVDVYTHYNICDLPPYTLGCGATPARNGPYYRYSAAYAGDAVFIANRRLQCQTWAAAGVPAYCFRFAAQPNGLNIYSGVPHFQEVAFVFDNVMGVGYAPPLPFTNKPQNFLDLASLMSKSWASFINSGNPNGWVGKPASSPDWPAYSVATPQDMLFDANITGLAVPEADTWRQEGIALINSLNIAYQR